MKKTSLVFMVFAALVALMSTGAVHAETGDDRAQVRALVTDAAEKYDAGDFAGALVLFSEAYQRARVPTVGLFVARCQKQLGKRVDAYRTYREVVAESTRETSSKQVRQALAEASAEKAALEREISFITIAVRGARGQHRVAIDGHTTQPVDGSTWVTEPGAHRVRVEADGHLGSERTITLAPGEKAELELQLEPESAAKAGSAPLFAGAEFAPDRGAEEERREQVRIARAREQSEKDVEARRAIVEKRLRDAEAKSAKRRTYTTVGYVSLAVGGLALAVSAYSYSAASRGKAELELECVDRVCPSDSRSRLDSARNFARAATWSAVAGAGFALTGVVLLVAAPPAEVETAGSNVSGVAVRGAF